MGIPFQTFQGSNCSNGSGGLTMSGVIGKLTSESRGTHEKGTGQFWESSAQADDQSIRAIRMDGLVFFGRAKDFREPAAKPCFSLRQAVELCRVVGLF